VLTGLLLPVVQNGTWTPAALTAVIQSHISHVVGHYAGACYSWDVVNEALGNNGSVESSVFFDTLGEEFIDISFAAAAQADPKAKLYYNDFGMENGGRKANGAVALVKRLQAANIRIDGVGLQAHLVVGQTPSRAKLAGVLGMFTSLGVEVALTELDIRFNKLPANDTAVQQQAADYVSVVGACLDVAKCVGVVIWEFTDKYSWIPGTFPGTGDACLWDADLKEKPAYTSVSSLLAAAAATPSAGGATVNVNSGDSAGSASKNGTRSHGKTSTSSALAMVTGSPSMTPTGVVTVSGTCGMSGMMTSFSAMLVLSAAMLLFF
jgi:endo-1,4-beta-xylanase